VVQDLCEMGKKLVKSEGDIRRSMMMKRNWVREGDVVLVSPWDFEYEDKGDIIFRYTQNQAYWLRDKGFLKIG